MHKDDGSTQVNHKTKKKYSNLNKKQIGNQYSTTNQYSYQVQEESKQQISFQNQVNVPIFIKWLDKNKEEQEQEAILDDILNKAYEQNQLQTNSNNIDCLQFTDNQINTNTEYTLKMVNPQPERFEQLTVQMAFRLREGNGEAIYLLGLENNGTPVGLNKEDMQQSFQTLFNIAQNLKVDVTILQFIQGIKGLIAQIMVRQKRQEGIKLDIKILLLGESKSGKSTLISVLGCGQYDNGNGQARNKILNYQHEIFSGTTQSISHHFLGMDSQGKIVNYGSLQHNQFGNNKAYNSLESIVDESTKIITFIDIGGHKKAEKQLVTGLVAHYPDYALLVASAKSGITRTSEEHMNYASVFNLPLIIIVTHIDIATDDDIDMTLQQIEQALTKNYKQKIPIIVRCEEDIVLLSRAFIKEQPLPIFLLSNVTGVNIDQFKYFLNLLPIKNEVSQQSNEQYYKKSPEFFIHDTFTINNQIILAGTVIKGQIKVGQKLHIGPDKQGAFHCIEILEIHCKRIHVKSISCGQICTLAIRPVALTKEWLQENPNSLKKGMVLVESSQNPKASTEFLADIWLIDQQQQDVILRPGYQPVVTTQTSRQQCKIIICKERFLSNKEEEVELSNLQNPTLIRRKSKSTDSKSSIISQKSKMQKTIVYSKNFLKKLQMKRINKISVDLFGSKASNENFQQKQLNNLDCQESPQLHCRSSNTFNLDDKLIKIKANQKNKLRLRFMYSPQYITVGQKLIINDELLKANGWIKEIFY